MVEPLSWYEMVAYTYWAIVCVSLVLLDLVEIFFKKTVEYTYFGVFFMFVLGFPGFAVALITCLCIRLILWFVLQIGTAVNDPDKFLGNLKFFSLKDKKR